MQKMYRKIGGRIGSALLSIGSGVSQGKNEIFEYLKTPFPVLNCSVNKSYVEPVSININLSVSMPNISNSAY